MTDAELNLWERYRQNDEKALEELISSYYGMVRFWVDRVSLSTGSVNREDLIQEGLIGLIKAIELFDPSKGREFKDSARFFIREAIFDSLEVRLSRRQAYNYRKVSDAFDRLIQKFKREPTVEEITKETGLTNKQIMDGLDAMSIAFAGETQDSTRLVVHGSREGFERLQKLLQSGGLSDEVRVNVKDIQWAETARREERVLIKEALSTLSERENSILSRHYFDEESPREIAEKLGLSESQVAKIRMRAIKKLRVLLEEKS